MVYELENDLRSIATLLRAQDQPRLAEQAEKAIAEIARLEEEILRLQKQ